MNGEQMLGLVLGAIMVLAFAYAVGYTIGSVNGYGRGIEDGERRARWKVGVDPITPEEVLEQKNRLP